MVLVTGQRRRLSIIRSLTQHNLRYRKHIRATVTVGPKPQLIPAILSSTWEDLHLGMALLRQPIVTRNNYPMLEVSTGMLGMGSSLSSSSQAASNSLIAVRNQ
jgi:hypothetical protein